MSWIWPPENPTKSGVAAEAALPVVDTTLFEVPPEVTPDTELKTNTLYLNTSGLTTYTIVYVLGIFNFTLLFSLFLENQ